ncbi:MAG TPA: UDP-2,3-diacylglucosamine diphosphatase [Candidatus Thioglobus sp.]|jgi:UDP-2,3-diacylglucosamine hydrolase|nr:UDP-2,3-diacylglucosamine diphosphatase [Candidatus Thioglobus sp.]HIL21471.1 UDP-2,3-diacylglucosamine diphosphatase [Candidatus Thioglobus sp.]
MSKTLIIADLHLTSVEGEKLDLFCRFCQTEAVNADQLFILGDLFNTWIGDDISLVDYHVAIDCLKELTKSTAVFVMIGNRDFLLGKKFEQQSGCKLIKESHLLKHNDQDYVLVHGDSLCTDDIDYQKMKKVLRNCLVQSLFLSLPKKWRLKLSGEIRKKSIEAQSYKSEAIMDVNLDAVNELMAKHPGANLIHGHTHRQNTHLSKAYTRYVLGDWSTTSGNAITLGETLEWLKIH